jgi:hypothetical protein
MATVDCTHNNHGHGDVGRDHQTSGEYHSAYRCETVDALGKGSFRLALPYKNYAIGGSAGIKNNNNPPWA